MSAHVFVAPSQYSPALASQPGAVWRLGSHVTPTLLPAVSHVPDDAVDGVTHDRPAPHGWSASQDPPPLPIDWQSCVAFTHVNPCEHEVVAHESPAAFDAAHVPQLVPFTIAQLLLWHCPPKAHGAPFAPLPTRASHSGMLPSSKSLH